MDHRRNVPALDNIFLAELPKKRNHPKYTQPPAQDFVLCGRLCTLGVIITRLEISDGYVT